MSTSSRPRSMPGLSHQYTSIDHKASYTGRRKPSGAASAWQQTQSIAQSADSEQVSSALDPGCDFATLLRHPYFCTHHVHYACTDATLGVILLQIAIEGKTMHCHIFSSAGSMAVANLPLASQKSPSRILSQSKDEISHSVLVLALSEYISRMSPRVRNHLQANARASLGEDYITKLANSCERIKPNEITGSLSAYLAPKFSRSVIIDVIAPVESKLRSILPKPLIVKDNDVEINKFPVPPNQENVEKRENLIHEILATERTYVSRLQHLIKDYAQPLRTASRKQKGILGPYQTNNLFPSSLDAIFLLNQDFLKLLEGSSGDYQFALTLVNGFRDFRKVYSRYLETSSSLDQILRDALKLPKFKEFTDQARLTASANIGIRELVMEPISRIPRYSLLITSLLNVITPSNPAYPVFKEALTVVRRIGYMERDRQELSQEKLMKLAALVSSWPTELVKSSVRVISYVDCLDLSSMFRVSVNSQVSGSDGIPCSLVLFSDRLVILKRSRDVRIEEILQSTKKGDLGYRGYVMLDSVQAIEGDDCMYMTFREEVVDANSDRWINRPLRKYAIMASDAARFVRQLQDAQFKIKGCDQAQYLENYDNMSVRFAVYTPQQWSAESELLKSAYRLWEDIDDGNMLTPNLTISEDHGKWSCNVREASKISLLCRDVSLTILKNAVMDKFIQYQQESWLNPMYDALDQFSQINAKFAADLLIETTTTNISNKSRPTSPSKIMSSFLGRRDRDAELNSLAGARPGTGTSERSFSSHTIVKRKSNQLFNFGGEDRSESGIETFISSILQFEHFAHSDFSPANATETKQINSLVNLISKDPKKGFAILGSPSKVALHGLKIFCRTILSKKLTNGCLIPDLACQKLRTYVKQTQEVRVHKMKDIIIGLPQQNIGILRSLLRCALHVQDVSEEESTVKGLLLFSEMIVSSLTVTAFIGTLEVLLQDYDSLFCLSPQEDMRTRGSVTSNMSLLPDSSRFGSTSSQSFSNYLADPSSSSHFTGSPAKLSSVGEGTPELVNGMSSPDDTNSLLRSLSNESVTYPMSQELDKRCKRVTVDGNYAFRKDNIFGFSASEPHLAGISSSEKSLPPPPDTTSGILRSFSDQLACQSFEKAKLADNMEAKDGFSVYSALPKPQAPFMVSNPAMTESFVTVQSRSDNTMESRSRTPPRRNITPSKIPVPSPQIGHESPSSTPSHSRQSSLALGLSLLSSKKESSIPRLPSTLSRRRESLRLSRSYSNPSFTFDIEMSDSLDLALKYNDQQESFVTSPTLSDMQELIEPPILSDLVNTRRASREHMRREIASDGRISSASTIRRISRQLQKTEIGPLEIPLPPIPDERSGQLSSPAYITAQSSELAQPELHCNPGCGERFELIQLELKHYKNLYRQAAEEIDITIDVANEQIAELHNALEQGSVEATALGLLELEKEKNRKLILELAELRGRMTN